VLRLDHEVSDRVHDPITVLDGQEEGIQNSESRMAGCFSLGG
jgi:hypothetical protein